MIQRILNETILPKFGKGKTIHRDNVEDFSL